MSFFDELKRRNVFKVAAVCDLIGDGNIERARDVLEKHARSSEVYIYWLNQDSDWDTVRSNPRFDAIVDRLRK